jgi:hypothetical protein
MMSETSFRWRLLTAAALLLSLLWSLALSAGLLLEIIVPGEDHDFDTPWGYIGCAFFAGLATFLGYTFWRHRRWFVPRPPNTDS